MLTQTMEKVVFVFFRQHIATRQRNTYFGGGCSFNSLSASLLLNILLSFEVGIAHAIANFK